MWPKMRPDPGVGAEPHLQGDEVEAARGHVGDVEHDLRPARRSALSRVVG